MKGKAVYSAIPVNQFNNADIQEVFALEYDRKVRCGGSYSSSLQLLTVAGQFLRLIVVCGHADVLDLCKLGQLFRAVTDRETVELFLIHYDSKTQYTTVMTKELHLRKMCWHAKLYFMDKDQHMYAQAERSRLKLQNVFNVQKALGRRLATRRK